MGDQFAALHLLTIVAAAVVNDLQPYLDLLPRVLVGADVGAEVSSDLHEAAFQRPHSLVDELVALGVRLRSHRHDVCPSAGGSVVNSTWAEKISSSALSSDCSSAPTLPMKQTALRIQSRASSSASARSHRSAISEA